MLVRRLAAALCAAAVLLCTASIPVRAAAPAAVPAAASNPVVPAHVRTLANGLRVVVLEDHAAPVAAVNMWYRFGGAYEKQGKTGLAHALEHMMFRGTTTLSASGLDDWGARLSAQVNAETTNEYTRFDLVLPADRVDGALRVEADRMHNLKLAPADWDKERGAVLQEWTQDHSNALFGFGTGLQEKLYPGSALGKTALGEKRDIEKATVADLRAYYHTWYAPNNATLVVTGDVDPDTVFASAQKWFGPIPSRTVPKVTIVPPKAATGVVERVKADYPFTVVDLAYAAPPPSGATEEDGLRTLVAVTALQNPRGPFRNALVDSGITLGFGMEPSLDRHVATIHAFLLVAPGHTADQARTAWKRVLAASLARGLDSEYVEAAKRSELTGLVFARDSIAGLASALGSAYVFPGDRDPTTYAAEIESVDAASVTAVARRVFAKPNADAELEPTTTDPAKAKPPSDLGGTVKDDFGGRVPDGAVVQPAWMRTDLARPLALRSRVAPVQTTLPNGLKLLVQRVHDNGTRVHRRRDAPLTRLRTAGQRGRGRLSRPLCCRTAARTTTTPRSTGSATTSARRSASAPGSARTASRATPTSCSTRSRTTYAAPTLPEDRFVLIRQNSAVATERRAVDPGYRASRAFAEALYPANDPALRQSSKTSLESITIDDVRAFVKKYDRPDLTTLVIVGDVDPDAVKASVARAFGDWHADGPAPDPHLQPIPLPSPVRKLVETPSLDVSVELGQPAPAEGDVDADAFMLADALLDDQSFASRLFREVREKRGLVYNIGTTYESDRDRGTWVASFRAVPSKVDAAEALVRDQVKRLQNELVDPEELRRCATRQAARILLAEQSTATIAGDLMNIGTDRLPADYYSTLAERYARVTPADVERAAREYFHPDHFVEIRTGPKT